jgi:hypothetical protein
MSFVMTLVNVGLNDKFLLAWFKAYVIGISIGIPTAIVVSPLINKWIGRVTN